MLTPLTLGGLVAGFSVTHIGLSAVREPLIAACGATADGLGLVGRGWRLPEAWWPADAGGLEVWPDAPTEQRAIPCATKGRTHRSKLSVEGDE